MKSGLQRWTRNDCVDAVVIISILTWWYHALFSRASIDSYCSVLLISVVCPLSRLEYKRILKICYMWLWLILYGPQGKIKSKGVYGSYGNPSPYFWLVVLLWMFQTDAICLMLLNSWYSVKGFCFIVIRSEIFSLCKPEITWQTIICTKSIPESIIAIWKPMSH